MVEPNKLSLRLTVFVISLFILMPLISDQKALGFDTKKRVYDYADLLTTEEVRNLEALAFKHSEKRETDFIILTSKRAKGKDIVAYMEDFYDENGLGYDKSHGNTVIITLNMEQRDIYVAGFYKGQEYLGNKRCDMVRRKVTPDLSKGDYYKAFKSYIQTSSKYMRYRPGANPNSPLYNIWAQLGLSILVGGMAVGNMVAKSSGNRPVSEEIYRDPYSSRINAQHDTYMKTTTTKTRRPSSNSSGGGGGTSRGGHSHSGSRGKF